MVKPSRRSPPKQPYPNRDIRSRRLPTSPSTCRRNLIFRMNCLRRSFRTRRPNLSSPTRRPNRTCRSRCRPNRPPRPVPSRRFRPRLCRMFRPCQNRRFRSSRISPSANCPSRIFRSKCRRNLSIPSRYLPNRKSPPKSRWCLSPRRKSLSRRRPKSLPNPLRSKFRHSRTHRQSRNALPRYRPSRNVRSRFLLSLPGRRSRHVRLKCRRQRSRTRFPRQGRSRKCRSRCRSRQGLTRSMLIGVGLPHHRARRM